MCLVLRAATLLATSPESFTNTRSIWSAVATVGTAYFSHARELISPQRTLQPFVSIEVGVGW